MIKILVNNEEVVCSNNISIKEEMLSTSSTILKNCYPKSWENTKDYVNNYYFPKDYSKCKITDDVYHPEVIGTRVSGTNFTINYDNTLNWNLEEIKGNTLQNGTPTPSSPVEIQSVTGLQKVNVCGKNLINNALFTTGSATLVSYDDNKVVVNYTSVYTAKTQYIDITTGYYTFSVGNISNSTARVEVYKYKNGNAVGYAKLVNANETYTIDNTDNSADQIRITLSNRNLSGTNEITFNNLMLEKGNQSTSFEPYKGNTYEVNLGKNIWSVGNKNVSWATNYVDVKNILNTLSEGTYSITLNFKVTEIVKEKTNNSYGFAFHNSNGLIYNKKNTNSNINVDDNFVYTYTFTISSSQVGNFTNAYFYGFGNDTDGVTAKSLMYDCQLEKGSQTTSYSPYFTPIELNKIGDYQDKIYKDNGTWYIEKNIGKVVLNGSEANWVKSGNTTFDRFILGTNIYGIVAQGGYSNYFKVVNINVASNLYEMSNNGNSQLVFNYSTYGTTDLPTFKTWLSTHNTTVYYVLATPTYTEITNTELINQLESIELLKETNNITITSENLPMIMQLYYNYKEAYTSEDLLFCGCVKNTGNINLNPRQPHFVDLQVLDFKTLLSEGETLNYVITGKTIVEAINQVVNSISDYGFVVGNIQLLNPNEMIGAYSTLNKTAYDVFQYFAEITQSRWTTRMIDENTIAIDFYDPTLMPTGTPIESTQTYYKNNNIIDISFNYSTNDYRNKQIMTSDEVYANITQTETIIADGYTQNFMCQNKLGIIETITVNGVSKTFATKSEQKLGITADFYYQPGEMQFVSSNTIGTGIVIVITYYPIVKGREIILNTGESTRIGTQIGRKGTLSRYENRNDTTSSQELQKIGQSYIKYKGQAEIQLKVKTKTNLWNVGEILSYNAPLEELSTEYMVKSKEVDWYAASNETFYIYELTSNFNYENAVNYFDNQRAKNQGNIGEGETITRNIDLTNDALILFYDTNVEEIQVLNPTSLDFALDGVLI